MCLCWLCYLYVVPTESHYRREQIQRNKIARDFRRDCVNEEHSSVQFVVNCDAAEYVLGQNDLWIAFEKARADVHARLWNTASWALGLTAMVLLLWGAVYSLWQQYETHVYATPRAKTI